MPLLTHCVLKPPLGPNTADPPNPQLKTTHNPKQIVMRVFTPSAAKQLALAPVDVRRSDPRTGEEVRAFGSGWLVGWCLVSILSFFGGTGRRADRR